MNKKPVLLVINPISGAKDKSEIIEHLKKKIEAQSSILESFYTTGQEDVFNLREKINHINPGRVIVIGGDGTLKITAEALKNSAITIGLIPAGSANGLANNLQIPTSLEEQIDVALGDTLLHMDTVSLNEEICLHMSDFGLNAELIRKFEESPFRGKIAYALTSLPTLLRSNYPFSFIIETNGEIYEREAILLAIANAKSYGTGSVVNPKGELNDGLFEILIFKQFDLQEITKSFMGKELDPKFVEVISTNAARIRSKNPVAFQIDGEYRGEKQEILAKIAAVQIKIAVPKKFKLKKLLLSQN